MFTLSQCSFFYESVVWYRWAYRNFLGNTSNKSCSVTLFRLDWQTGMLSDSLLIVFISIFTALLSEGFSWLLIYRTDKYKRLQSEVEKQSKKRKFQVQKTLSAILDQDSNCQLVSKWRSRKRRSATSMTRTRRRRWSGKRRSSRPTTVNCPWSRWSPWWPSHSLSWPSWACSTACNFMFRRAISRPSSPTWSLFVLFLDSRDAWLPSCHSSPSHGSEDYRTAVWTARTTQVGQLFLTQLGKPISAEVDHLILPFQTVPSCSCISFAPCQFVRTFRRFSALSLRELWARWATDSSLHQTPNKGTRTD